MKLQTRITSLCSCTVGVQCSSNRLSTKPAICPEAWYGRNVLAVGVSQDIGAFGVHPLHYALLHVRHCAAILLCGLPIVLWTVSFAVHLVFAGRRFEQLAILMHSTSRDPRQSRGRDLSLPRSVLISDRQEKEVAASGDLEAACHGCIQVSSLPEHGGAPAVLLQDFLFHHPESSVRCTLVAAAHWTKSCIQKGTCYLD